MPIPTGPYPNNHPNSGDGNPERGLPLPPVIPSGSTPVSQGSLPPIYDDYDDEETFSPIPVDEVGYDDEPEEEILPIPPRRPVRQRTVVEQEPEEEDYTSDLDEEEDSEDKDDSSSPILDLKKDRRGKREKPSKEKPRKEKPSRKDHKGKKSEIEPGYTEDTFIDEKSKKLKPFGRDSQRSAKVGEFDQRKNMRNQQKIVQFIFVGLALAAVCLGLFRVLVPPKTLHRDEVMSMINDSTGNNGFPQQEGGAFAQEFMKAYLSNDDSPVTQRVLSYYYTGKMDGASSGSDTQVPQGDFTQRVVYGPTMYSSIPVNPNSGSYIFGALVEPSSSQGKAPADGSAVKWVFFNVNVYQDKKTNTFSIAHNSPTVVPATTAGDMTSLPQGKTPGTGPADARLTESTRSVVVGFVKGYASSSSNDHTAVDQYVTSTTNPALTQGLDGQYSLAADDDSSVTTAAYASTVPGEVKVQVKVQWLSRAVGAGNAANVYTSNYVATLVKQSNGKYLVSKFTPEHFIPKAEGE